MEELGAERGFNLSAEKNILEQLSGASVMIVPSHFRPDSYSIFFDFGGGSTEVSVATTFQPSEKKLLLHMVQADNTGQGLGTNVLQSLIALAQRNGFVLVAKEVQTQSEAFWKKMGFAKCPEPNPKNDFQYEIEQEQ